MATVHIGSLDNPKVEAKISQNALEKASEIASSLDKPLVEMVALTDIVQTDDLTDAKYLRNLLGSLEDIKNRLEQWVDNNKAEGSEEDMTEAILDIVSDENIFDVTEALYAWLMHNYEGQSSDKYEKLCQLPFEPGPMWSDSQVEQENHHYQEISEENYEKYFDEINEFLDRAESATTVSL